MTKFSIREKSEQEIAEWLQQHNQPKFRAGQIRQWLFEKYIVSFDEMANIPKPLREQLDADFLPIGVRPVETFRADDGTVKWLSELYDGEKIETVLIRAPERNTVCISTQVGCAVRCVFCESGRLGFVRNLRTMEIVEQVILASHECGARVDNIVVMGTGEPMNNLDNLIPALDFICDQEKGLGLGARHITVSTSGIPNGIRRLADQQKPWNLALSLHAPTDELRSRIIPDHHRHPLAEVFEACTAYHEATGRMLTFEYVLVSGLNDAEKDAFNLARLARKYHAKVNLIPCNKGAAKLAPPTPEQCNAFLQALTSRGVQATIRLKKGDKIKAACGQLTIKRKSNNENLPPKP